MAKNPTISLSFQSQHKQNAPRRLSEHTRLTPPSQLNHPA